MPSGANIHSFARDQLRRQPHHLGYSVLLLQLLVLLGESVNTVYHALDQLNLRVSQSMFVGYVVRYT